MKFTVRDGFFLQFTTQQDNGNGGQMSVPAFFPGGKTVELPDAIAAANLHMLEPADKYAAAFCEARHVPTAVAGPAAVDAQAIAAATVAALVQLGVINKPTPPAGT